VSPTFPPVLLHLHIPRSSGSSLHGWFLKGLGERGVIQANGAAAVRAAVEARRGPLEPAVVSGHFSFGVHEALADQPYRYVLLLREPVERMQSLFRYIRGLPAHRDHAMLQAPDMTIARFYASSHSGRLPGSWSRDAMVAQLAGVMGTGAVPTEEHLERAWANLRDGKVIYASAEDPAPVLKQTARMLGISKPPPFPKVNPSPQAAGEAWGSSPADIAAITEANRLDIELYRRAMLHLAGMTSWWRPAGMRRAMAGLLGLPR
jgi:hypothetical protein